MSAIGEAVRAALLERRDEAYRAFLCPLLPTVPPDTVLGVRTPALRKLSRELLRRSDALDYLNELPHRFYEENLVHCRFLESLRDFETVIAELERFLPCVDNWAVCDTLNPALCTDICRSCSQSCAAGWTATSAIRSASPLGC